MTARKQAAPLPSPYDLPEYLDLAYTVGSAQDVRFLRRCFQQAKRKVQTVYDPSCGSGRVVWRLAQAGYRVIAIDMNPRAIAYLQKKLERKSIHNAQVAIGNMVEATGPSYDAVYSLGSDFCEVLDDAPARRFIANITGRLRAGGVFVLGIHVRPRHGQGWTLEEETSASGRGTLLASYTIAFEGQPQKNVDAWRLRLFLGQRKKKLVGESRILYRVYDIEELLSLVDQESRGSLELLEVFTSGHNHYCKLDLKRDLESLEGCVLLYRKRKS
jgi:SAM-dependent methyltransferase